MINDVVNFMKKIYLKLNECINKKSALIGITVIMVLLLTPMIIASFYSHPSADDFGYGIFTINTLKSKGLISLLVGVFKAIHRSYNVWQGTFSAVALFSLNPSVFGNNLYFLTTIIIITTLFLSIFMLFREILVNGLRLDKNINIIVSMIFTMLCIQTVPDKTQAFYWWNGASYYMIFFSLELIEISLLIRAYIYNRKTNINFMILCMLVVFISGGNYITALQQIIILFLLNSYLLLIKKDKSAIHLFVIAVLGLGISAIAPGNMRRAIQLAGMSPLKAIFMSFVFAWKKAIEWFKPLNIFIIMLLTMIVLPSLENTKYKFNYPLLILIVSFGLFAAEFTPTLYSTSSIGEGRLWNIMYISYLLLLLLLVIYVIGFLREKLIYNKVISTKVITKSFRVLSKYNIIFVSFVTLFIGINMYNNRYDMTSYSCYKLLKSNDAIVFDREYKERMKVLEDDNIKNVEFKEFSVYPYPIFYSDIGEDPDDWRNEPIARIYHKNYVKLIKDKHNH